MIYVFHIQNSFINLWKNLFVTEKLKSTSYTVVSSVLRVFFNFAWSFVSAELNQRQIFDELI